MRYIERDLPIEGLNAIAEKEGNAKKPIYQIHKWWARRLGSIFRMLILAAFTEWDDSLSPEENQKLLWERFYSKNELKSKEGNPPIILDPFMGGGTTVVEALRLGCKVIGIDLNPVAWFVTKKEIDPIDFQALDAAFKHLETTVAPRIKHYYRTTCPTGHEADIMYIFWVKKAPCLACGEEVRLFHSFRIATKNGRHTVFCPQCYHISNDISSLDTDIVCPECGYEYIPSQGHSGRGKYTCPTCGQKENILKAIQRREGPPDAEMFALEYYCKVCGRGYKRVTSADKALYEEARAEFQRLKDNLPFPRTKIPKEGRSDPRPINHGYKYFYQMFNDRQLLCLSLLLEEIIKIRDENTKEYLLLALSNDVDWNNMFCRYAPTFKFITDLFARHAFWPTNQPTEANVWGTNVGQNFTKHFKKVKKAKSWWVNPDGIGDAPSISVFESGFDFSSKNGNVALRSQTAEDLSFISDVSVDAVITDPPYCDNVMYSELADFFYVWLRQGLQDRYPECFSGELSPRARELVKNDALGKDEDFFFDGLARCFKECYRVLKDDGILIFTFHHKQPWAWKSVLSGLVEASFCVTSVYPVQSEELRSTHIMEGGIAYDIPFICRKRVVEPKKVAWETLKDEIHTKVEQTVTSIRRSGQRISDSDLFVIVMGRCLEVYSRHWPNVMRGGQQVDIDTAVDEIETMVDSLIKSHELKLLPVGLDETTQFYLLYIAGERGLTWDDLHKRFTTGGGISLEKFNQRFYLEERKGRKVAPTTPTSRLEFLEKEIDKGHDLPLIDIAHYLYAVMESGLDVRPELERWQRDGLVQVLDLLYKKTAVKAYDRLREHAEAVGIGQRRLL